MTDVENEEDPDGWWSGTLNGKRGLFPHNFVKLVRHERASEPLAAGRC